MTPFDAIQRAVEKGLDLVEVAPGANPPVCRIMDYGKYKYELKKKQAVSQGEGARGDDEGSEVTAAHRRARPRLQVEERAALPDRRGQGQGHADVPGTRDRPHLDRARAARQGEGDARGHRGRREPAPHGRPLHVDDPRAQPRSDPATRTGASARGEGGRPRRAARPRSNSVEAEASQADEDVTQSEPEGEGPPAGES